MQIARVLGSCTATVCHRSFRGQRLLIVQPLTGDQRPDGDPQIAVDAAQVGAGAGNLVLISSDGKGTQQLVGDEQTPIRWTILGHLHEPAGGR